MDGFVEVTVDATGKTQMVPEHFIGDPIVGRGLTPVDAGGIDPVPVSAPLPPADVDTVLGEENSLPLTPAARDAALEAGQAVADAAEADPPTERSTHEEIDAYAAAQTPPVDLTGATTKAEKLAVIGEHTTDTTTDTDDTPSPNGTPAAGDEEN